MNLERPKAPSTSCEVKLNFEKPPKRLSYDDKEKFQLILDDYLDKGYIRPSESEFTSPIVLVKKPGELRTMEI